MMILTRIYKAFYCSKKSEVRKATRRNDVERSEDNSTLSPWFSAVISNDVSSVESQLQHDTDVNALESGWSALHTAAWNGYTDLCSVLLKSGADPDICGPSGVTPLCLAAQQGHADVVRQLIEASCNVRCLADIDGSRSVTPLHLAARNGHGDVVRLLVAAGVDVEAPMTSSGVCGLTALHLAVESGHLDIIDVLLDAGSNVNSETLSAMESTC